jgi:ubiquinone/menaquinone biosynthesis C-methylase UbiE
MTSMLDTTLHSAEEIRRFFRSRATPEPYATSPDWNLREVEIEYIARHLTDGARILDVGCGNGYSTLAYAARVQSALCGIDFVPEMIASARRLRHRFELRGTISFCVGDATHLSFSDGTFDVVISQRCLLNLGSRRQQWEALTEIARVLKGGGLYLMLEGTRQGLEKMNCMRARFGLSPIPEADPKSNWCSNKFDEEELLEKIGPLFRGVEAVQRFGMYYFLSRVVHPLLVRPEAPRFDAVINSIARRICSEIPDYEGLGHVALWVLRK